MVNQNFKENCELWLLLIGWSKSGFEYDNKGEADHEDKENKQKQVLP